MAWYDTAASWFRGPRNNGTAFSATLPTPEATTNLAAPTLADEFVLLRQYQRKQQLASMRGRASTFLTGPRGIGAGLPTSEIAMALLRAQIAEPEQPYTVDTTTDAVAAAFERRTGPSAPSAETAWRRPTYRRAG